MATAVSRWSQHQWPCSRSRAWVEGSTGVCVSLRGRQGALEAAENRCLPRKAMLLPAKSINTLFQNRIHFMCLHDPLEDLLADFGCEGWAITGKLRHRSALTTSGCM